MKFIKHFFYKFRNPLKNMSLDFKLCNCIEIRELPSVFCSVCGEIQCLKCSQYYKCSSCSTFVCDDCNINLLCNHNYCSVNCVLDNKEHVCTNYCFFLRDIYATVVVRDNIKDDKALENLLDYWSTKVNKKEIKKWVSSTERTLSAEDTIYSTQSAFSINISSLKDKITELKKLLKLS